MMADELKFLQSEIQNCIADADADLIPVTGQLEVHGRCRYGPWRPNPQNISKKLRILKNLEEDPLNFSQKTQIPQNRLRILNFYPQQFLRMLKI